MVSSKNIIALSDEELAVISGGEDERVKKEEAKELVSLAYHYVKRHLGTRAKRIEFAYELVGASLGYYFLYYCGVFGEGMEASLSENVGRSGKIGLVATKIFCAGINIISVLAGAEVGREVGKSFCEYYNIE